MAFLAYGLTIDADVALGIPTVERLPEVTVRQRPDSHDAVRWLTETDKTGWRAGRSADDFVLAFDDRAEFGISPDGAQIRWWAPNEKINTLVHLLLDHVVPMAVARQGRTILHAAGLVSPDGRGYAIAGLSGAGKSTLAAALVSAGHLLLADDCVVIEFGCGKAMAIPAYPGLRLWDRSFELVDLGDATIDGRVTQHGSKRRIGVTAPWDGDRRHELSTVFVLRSNRGEGSPAVLEALGPAAAALTLLPHSFRLHDMDERRTALDGVNRLGSSTEVRMLDNVHTPAGLSRSVQAITQTLLTTVRSN